MNSKAMAALEAQGVGGEEHRATSLTGTEIAGTTLILTMTQEQAKEVLWRYPEAKGKVFSLAEYAKRGGDVADPYGGDEASYQAAATVIGDALDAFVERIPAGAAVAKP